MSSSRALASPKCYGVTYLKGCFRPSVFSACNTWFWNCLVCRVTCQLSIETPGDSAHVFQRTKVDRQLIEVRSSEYATRRDDWTRRGATASSSSTVERRHKTRMAPYQRPQLYKVTPARSDTRSGHILPREPICHAGLEEGRQVTVPVIGNAESSHNITQEARILKLRGPHMGMSSEFRVYIS